MPASWLDRLHPVARAAVVLLGVLPAVAFVGAFFAAIVTANGVTGVDWAATLTAAINVAGVAFASGGGTLVALYVTPLTRDYGIGSASPSDAYPDFPEALPEDDDE